MKTPLKYETQWLRQFARTYLPHNAPVEFDPAALRDANVTLLHLVCLFRGGWVVFSNKLDGPGAFWTVEGPDCDGAPIRASLEVQTQEMSIKVMKAERLDDDEQGPENSAA